MSAARAKGTAAESAIVAYARSRYWPHARRIALNGTRDLGDLSLGDGIPVTLEVKNQAAMQLSTWLDEARTEAHNNNHRLWAVWHKRRGKGSPADWYVTTDGRVFTELLNLAGLR